MLHFIRKWEKHEREGKKMNFKETEGRREREDEQQDC